MNAVFSRNSKIVFMAPDQALFDEIYRRKLEHSRRFTPEQRFLASLELSDAMAEIMRDGVRNQFPDASEQEVDRRLMERVQRVRRLRESR
jgi:hypothetical protein